MFQSMVRILIRDFAAQQQAVRNVDRRCKVWKTHINDHIDDLSWELFKRKFG